ncbi:MAG: S41 family peptidase [Gemmatimonadota bacterium]|nr:S41 family peptidase [Gemmatimonadota bacterium]
MYRIRHCLVATAAFLLLGTPVAAQEPGNRKDILETDEARVFLEAFRTISRFHSSALGDSVLWERALQGLIEQLDDPYATVFTPVEYDQFREQTTGNYAGIGVQIGRLGARVTVTAVFRGYPADGAGMMVGDRIVWVEGHDATDWSLDQARDSIRGPPGTVVRIRVARDGIQDPIPMDIVRDNVHVSALEATEIEDGVAHIAIERIARGVAGELAETLTEYDDASSVIMDLRGNPGGYLDEALDLVDLLLAPGQTVASAEGINTWGEVERQSFPASSPPLLADKPFIVLVDGYSASAAEIIAGALQDHDRAVVVGQRTFGKGVVQTVYPLPAGRQIRITTGSWFTPLGRSLHRARHHDGTLVAEDETAAERVATASGRLLRTGGGVFPDLEVPLDSLKQEELALLNDANRAQLPFNVRIEEYAFELAKDAIAAGGAVRLPSSAFDDLARTLVEDGMDAEVVNNPVARAYLDWRTQMRYLDRADARSLALLVQSERDTALAEALRLARSARTPGELFALVGEGTSESSGR